MKKRELDFIVIGAQKSGTTSLCEYLRGHPEIALPAGKEAPYFSRDAIYRRGWHDYLNRWFSGADPKRRWGTVTPDYMVGGVLEPELAPAAAGGTYDEWTIPLRIRERLQDVRLVALLRDPVERAASHHAMLTLNGLEVRTFESVVRALVQPKALADARNRPAEATGCVVWGEYGRLLAPYFDVFGRQQILVVFTADLARRPADVMREVFDFIGVRKDLRPDNLGKRYRAAAARRRWSMVTPEGLQVAAARSRGARALWHTLPQGSRRAVDRQYERLAYRFDLWNRVSKPSAPERNCWAGGQLRLHFRSDTARLEELLRTSVPWVSTHP